MSDNHTDHGAKDNLEDIHPLARPFLFLSNPKVVKNFMWGVLALWLLFIAAGFFTLGGEKSHSPFENPYSYWIIGFVAFSVAVLCGWPLRALLMRKEDYYGEDDDD